MRKRHAIREGTSKGSRHHILTSRARTEHAKFPGLRSGEREVRGANTNVGHPEGWPTSALEPAGPADTGQLVVTAVSSTTKLVWSEESSTPLNFRVTVEPANEDRSKVFWAYPVALLRLE